MISCFFYILSNICQISFFFFFLIYCLYLCVGACVSLCVPCTWGGQGASEPIELELQVPELPHVGSGNWIQVHCKNSQSYFLNYFSFVCILLAFKYNLCCTMPTDARRGYWMPWNSLLATTWVLGIKPLFSARATNALNLWVVSSGPCHISWWYPLWLE